MPAKLKIPTKYLDGVAAIKALNDIQAGALAAELEYASSHDDGDDFAAGHPVADLPSARLAQLYKTLKELYRVREHEHLSIDEFVTAIIEAMNNAGREDVFVHDDEQSVLRRRLSRLLSGRAFGLEAKANDLQKDFEHLYCQSRVVTDLRPVFGDKVDDGPVRMLITHALRIGYHDFGNHKELYVALDDAHIERLIEQLTRAQEKARLLSGRYSIRKETEK